jgi:exodeoxyribonuclease VIII
MTHDQWLSADCPIPAVVSGMPDDYYHTQAPGVSNSGLKRVAQSPAHYKYPEERAPSRAMDIGTAIHTALLEPDRYASEYMPTSANDRRASEYKEAAKVYGEDKTLTATEVRRVQGMARAAYSQPSIAAQLGAEGHRELSVFAHDPKTGVVVKCRLDLLASDGAALDVKKTQDARPEAFMRAIWNYRYHVQAAFYSDVLLWATGQAVEPFRFLAIEENSPHGCKLYHLDEAAIDYGRITYREDLNRYAACLEADEWPAYDDGDDPIGLPAWAMNEYENELHNNVLANL